AAEPVIGHDQRRAWRQQLADALDGFRRKVDASKRLRSGRRRPPIVGGGWLDIPALLAAADVDWTGHMLSRHADRVPAHAGAAILDFHGGEDVGAQRLLRVRDLDRHLKYRDETLPHEDLLLPLADKDC